MTKASPATNWGPNAFDSNFSEKTSSKVNGREWSILDTALLLIPVVGWIILYFLHSNSSESSLDDRDIVPSPNDLPPSISPSRGTSPASLDSATGLWPWQVPKTKSPPPATSPAASPSPVASPSPAPTRKHLSDRPNEDLIQTASVNVQKNQRILAYAEIKELIRRKSNNSLSTNEKESLEKIILAYERKYSVKIDCVKSRTASPTTPSAPPAARRPSSAPKSSSSTTYLQKKSVDELIIFAQQRTKQKNPAALKAIIELQRRPLSSDQQSKLEERIQAYNRVFSKRIS